MEDIEFLKNFIRQQRENLDLCKKIIAKLDDTIELHEKHADLCKKNSQLQNEAIEMYKKLTQKQTAIIKILAPEIIESDFSVH